MSKRTYYERNRDVILSRAKDYYENNKEVLREKAKNKYRELLSEDEKNIKREYGRNRYHMSEEKKQRLKEYIKKTIVRLEDIFYRCRHDDKDAFQNCYRKDTFYLFFY